MMRRLIGYRLSALRTISTRPRPIVSLGSQWSYRQQSVFPTSIPAFQTRGAKTGPQTLEFQAETRKLLDIVTNSIYTDKEVFLRELISNASDALEKYRYKTVNNEVVTAGADSNALACEINILTDMTTNTLTIIDNGIGMNRDELISNLGTIARSGSKQFVQSMGAGAKGSGIIGQFGVGFYSSFMISDLVTVESVAASLPTDGQRDGIAHRWVSDGSGQFTIDEIDAGTIAGGLTRGCKITMKLKEDCKEYADAKRIKQIINKYSNFVAFPVKINGEVVNTVSAIWMEEKSAVKDAQYEEFYRFISGSHDAPKYTIHFRTDAPIDLRCLFFVPTFHPEKFGGGRIEPGVNLYSRKVLIENKPADLLPDWLRFIKGVVDSEDLPLSLSREKPQDSRLLGRIRDVLTRKIVRFLEDQKKNDPVKYKEFYIEYNIFLKEGVCHDFKFMDQISKLLMFETSSSEAGSLSTLDDYISRCTPEQKNIYYLVAPTREAAMLSPYYETFKKHGIEVIFLYSTIDDFVMNNVKTFGGRPLISAETSSVDLNSERPVDVAEKKESEGKSDAALNDEQVKHLCDWFQNSLGTARVRQVKSTKRLNDSPACVTDHESGALRRMMKMVEQNNQGVSAELPPQVLEINPDHPIIQTLSRIAGGEGDQAVAKMVAEQVLDNALIAAGLVDDPRTMLPRLNKILQSTIEQHSRKA
jgi:TNF receptor-associated protein 1